jgi:small subunit ribosomal protein S6
VNPEVEGDDWNAVIERIKTLVERQGGQIASVDLWGMRRLAYPIQNHWEGQYVLMQLELGPQGVAELERDLALVEPVMRHLVVRLE